jgi:two-component system, chemotaxis family, chemotaxis protein CheY
MEQTASQVAAQIAARLEALRVLIVDGEPAMRKVTRSLLQAIGVKAISEAGDCDSGLAAIRAGAPDIVIVDWQMPGANGAEFMRRLRSPRDFPYPDVPVIMLTGHGERSRVVEAVRLGVNEFLLKPVSTNALLARVIAILTKPRRIVQKGDYYGPEPRPLLSYKPEADPSEVFLIG